MKYFVANWKANKNLTETTEWLKYFKDNFQPSDNITIILCPPFPLIYFTKEFLKSTNGNIYLGSQDLSFFEKGSYTGEITAFTLAGLVDYSIIGHHERRKYFKENDKILINASIIRKALFRIIFSLLLMNRSFQSVQATIKLFLKYWNSKKNWNLSLIKNSFMAEA